MYRSHDSDLARRFARFDTIPLPLSLRSLARARRAIARHSRHARREPRLTRGATSPSVLYECLLSPGGTRDAYVRTGGAATGRFYLPGPGRCRLPTIRETICNASKVRLAREEPKIRLVSLCFPSPSLPPHLVPLYPTVPLSSANSQRVSGVSDKRPRSTVSLHLYLRFSGIREQFRRKHTASRVKGSAR